MNTEIYDLVVLGGGAGGLTVAAGAAGFGAKVALIERSDQFGGDCLHYGCVPSKAFIAAAKQAHIVREAESIVRGNVRDPNRDDVLFLNALESVRKAIDHIQAHDDVERFRKLGVTLIHGFGRFKNASEIETDLGEVVQGKRFVIATGSRPIIPSIPGLDEAGCLTNETVFSLTRRPARLAVIGSGPIGLELAQSFARFGTEVTVLEVGDALLSREDIDVVGKVGEALRKELTILTASNILQVGVNADGTKTVIIKIINEEHELVVDEILVAAGRRPNTDFIGLDQAGVVMTGSHIAVDETMRTSVKHIFAVGDSVQAFPFTHAAGLEGKAVVANAVFGLRRKVSYKDVPWVIYTDPEVFHLGFTEQEARERLGDGVIVYSTSLDEVDRFVAERRMSGIVKLISDRKGRILGAHAVGPSAGDWMQEVVYAKTYGKKIGTLSMPVYPYPVRAAAIQRAADKYWRDKLFSSWLPKVLKTYIRWFR